LWIPAGERWSIDPMQAAWRIAFAGRGGYCYHLNGALGVLLRWLGYAVRGHVGGVQADGEPSPNAMGNHLVLTVTGLACDSNRRGSGTWTPASATLCTSRCPSQREPTSNSRFG
jgi:N-hydroxyarylamine O-acetyltransferase